MGVISQALSVEELVFFMKRLRGIFVVTVEEGGGEWGQKKGKKSLMRAG